MKRRLACVALLLIGLSGCGFRLRGPVNMAFTSVAIEAPPHSGLVNPLRRQLAAATNTQLSDLPSQAALRVEILSENRDKEVLSVNAQGRVREVTLSLRVRARALNAQNKEILPSTEFIQRRDLSFNESIVLAKEAEENLLYQEMQTEIIALLVQRIAALPATVP